jgi:hypothetical protein
MVFFKVLFPPLPREPLMSLKNLLFIFVAIGLVALPVSLFAAPQIEIDSADFDVGVVREENSTLAKHTYIVSNPGDSTLSILNVRPGCGCTTAGFDSVIPPGKTGRINVEVNIEHFPDGEFQKRISITSNAEKQSSYTLIIRGTKRNIISTEPETVHFYTGKEQDTGVTILLKTDRKNFSITSVTFSPNQNNEPLNWRSSIPMPFFLTKMPDTVEAKPAVPNTSAPAAPPLSIYKLKIPRSPNSREELYGQLIINTNLPEKPEVKISGMIEAAKP